MEENSTDIITLQETWLKGDKSVYEEFREKGFKILKFERTEKGGGGLAIFLNRKTCSKISSFYQYQYAGFENIVCSTTFGNKKLNIITIYRAPSNSKSEFLLKFDEFLSVVLERNGMIIMSGDFNIDLTKSDATATTFKSILHKYDLIQLITEPTRKSAILDYVIINYSGKSRFCQTQRVFRREQVSSMGFVVHGVS